MHARDSAGALGARWARESGRAPVSPYRGALRGGSPRARRERSRRGRAGVRARATRTPPRDRTSSRRESSWSRRGLPRPRRTPPAATGRLVVRPTAPEASQLGACVPSRSGRRTASRHSEGVPSSRRSRPIADRSILYLRGAEFGRARDRPRARASRPTRIARVFPAAATHGATPLPGRRRDRHSGKDFRHAAHDGRRGGAGLLD